MNELNTPIGGVGPEGAFDVVCLGQTFTIRYVVNMRTGATADMAINTIKHFKHAVQVLAAGYKEPSSAVGERDSYTDKLEHGDARTNAWTFRSFAVVPKGDRIFKVPINLCNEFTSAATLINWVLFAVEIMNNDTLADDFIHAGSIIIPNPQPKPQSELDKHFPRDENNKPVAPSQPPAQRTDYQAPPPEVIDIGNYDYKQQAQYEQDYVGRTVAINVSCISRDMEVKNDKSATYECLNVWGYYDGLPVNRFDDKSHPMYSFRMFAPKDGQKYGDWQTFFKHIQTGELSEPGKAITRPMRFYYKLAKGSGNNEGKVYWNLRKVDFLGDAPVSGGHSQEDDSGVLPNTTLPLDKRDESEIPF